MSPAMNLLPVNPFLSLPPSPVLKGCLSEQRPVHPALINLPFPSSPKRKASFYSRPSASFAQSINSWAEQVAPGSPNSPSKLSPTVSSRRPSSTSGNLSLSNSPRRPSEIIVPPPSSSFVFVGEKTPSSGAGENPFDLTTLGYTSNFVHLPNTPETPEEYRQLAQLRKRQAKADTTTTNGPKSASAGLKSFVLKPFASRGRAKSQSGFSVIPHPVDDEPTPPVPPMPSHLKSSDASSISGGATTVPKKSTGLSSLFPSRSKSASAPKPKAIIDPAHREALRAQMLQQQLDMANFIAGGKPRHHARDIAHDLAKATGQPVVVPIKRDGKYYWDEAERDEYKALLSPAASDRSEKKSQRRASISSTYSLGPLVQEARGNDKVHHLPMVPSVSPAGNTRSRTKSGASKGSSRHAPPSLPLRHSNFNTTTTSGHRFDDSFAPKTATMMRV